MTNKPTHGHKWMPIMYVSFYGILKKIAEKHGYALAVHGSFDRDLDLIAIPWIETVSDPEDMIVEMCLVMGADHPLGSVRKPHNRSSYSIITGGGGYVDISVIKPKEE